MGAFFHNLSIMEHHNFIAEFTGGQAVADVNGCAVSGDFVETGINFRFGNRVKSSRWLI